MSEYRDIPEHWKQTQEDLRQLHMEGYLQSGDLFMMEHLALGAWHTREMFKIAKPSIKRLPKLKDIH